MKLYNFCERRALASIGNPQINKGALDFEARRRVETYWANPFDIVLIPIGYWFLKKRAANGNYSNIERKP